MVENTDGVRRKPADPARLDETDRKLLGLLAEDSTRSYAELGRLLHLSAPAVHEREPDMANGVSVVQGSKVSTQRSQSRFGSDDAGIARASQLQHAVEDTDCHVDFARPTFVHT